MAFIFPMNGKFQITFLFKAVFLPSSAAREIYEGENIAIARDVGKRKEERHGRMEER